MQDPVHLISGIRRTNNQHSIPFDNNVLAARTDAYDCNICGHEFRKEGSLKRHMRVHTNKQRLTGIGGVICQVCNVSFQTSKDLAYHTQAQHSHDQAMKCSQCGCFRPMTENSQSKPFKCEGCAQSVKQNLALNGQSHVLDMHSQHVLYPPQYMSMPLAIHHPIPVHSQHHTATTAVVPHHMSNMARITDGTNIARITDGTNIARITDGSNAHVPDNTNAKVKIAKPIPTTSSYSPVVEQRPSKPYNCTECHKGFSHSSTLAMHKKLHTGDFKYMCEYCDKTFMLNEYYTRHMRVHTKEKPYKCEVCEKCFSQSNTLTQHKRTHTGEKPYACDLCGRQFSVRDYLNKHVRTHTGEKPYVCHVCDKKYSQASGLRAHQKQHSHFRSVI